VLAKLIKHDFKSQFPAFAILFAAGLIVPLLVFVITINADIGIQAVFRNLCLGLVPLGIVLIALFMSAKPFENDFNGKSAYLIQMLPAKVSEIMFSKALFFFIWNVLAICVAVISACFAKMDFVVFENLAYLFSHAFSDINTADEVMKLICAIIEVLVFPFSFFGFIIAALATGHLCGIKRKTGEALFSVGFVLLLVIYSIIAGNLRIAVESSAVGFDYFDTVNYYFSFLLNLAVTAAFYIYTHYVYTKKINVL
jgi:hypothetical protein